VGFTCGICPLGYVGNGVNCALTIVPVAIRVRVRLTLTTDQVSPILGQITCSVSQDLQLQVVVRSVKPGSIFVEFNLLPTTDPNYISAYLAYQTLVTDLHSPNSHLLHSGTYTRFIDVNLNWPFQAVSH
jgi:hypothetical protein